MIHENQMFGKTIGLINEFLMQCYHKIEEYIHYMLRCLHRCGIHPNPQEFVHIKQELPDGFSEGIVYPRTAIINGKGVVNPMFVYGFRIKTSDEILHATKPIGVFFSESSYELGMTKI